MRLVIDCANGAASRLAPALFRRLGLDVVAAYARPDGRNINAGCGSTFPAALQKLVASRKADLGMAFDGDADRVIFADARGRLLDGDHALFLSPCYLQRDRAALQPRGGRHGDEPTWGWKGRWRKRASASCAPTSATARIPADEEAAAPSWAASRPGTSSCATGRPAATAC